MPSPKGWLNEWEGERDLYEGGGESTLYEQGFSSEPLGTERPAYRERAPAECTHPPDRARVAAHWHSCEACGLRRLVPSQHRVAFADCAHPFNERVRLPDGSGLRCGDCGATASAQDLATARRVTWRAP